MAVTSFTLHLGISGDPCGLVLPSWVGNVLVLMGELRWSVITSNYMQSVDWSWVADVCLESWGISSVTNDFVIMYMQMEEQ